MDLLSDMIQSITNFFSQLVFTADLHALPDKAELFNSFTHELCRQSSLFDNCTARIHDLKQLEFGTKRNEELSTRFDTSGS